MTEPIDLILGGFLAAAGLTWGLWLGVAAIRKARA